MDAPHGTSARRKRGRPCFGDPMASLPPSATPEERAYAKAVSERRAKNRISAASSRRRKQARLEAAHREVAELRREHERLVAEHDAWVALLDQQYTEACKQHAQQCVSTCRWPAAACDLVIAVRVHATLPLGHFLGGGGGGDGSTMMWAGDITTAPAPPLAYSRQADTMSARGAAQVACYAAPRTDAWHLAVNDAWASAAAPVRRRAAPDAVATTLPVSASGARQVPHAQGEDVHAAYGPQPFAPAEVDDAAYAPQPFVDAAWLCHIATAMNGSDGDIVDEPTAAPQHAAAWTATSVAQHATARDAPTAAVKLHG